MKRIAVLFLVLTFTIAESSTAGSAGLAGFLRDQGDDWRIRTTESGTIRALYGQGTRSYSFAEEAVNDLLAQYSKLFGIEQVSALRLTSIEESENARHFSYSQYYGGLRVVSGSVVIHVDHKNRLIGASSEYKNFRRGSVAEIPDSLQAARRTAEKFVGERLSAHDASLMVLNTGDGTARPVWKIEVDSSKLSRGSWQFYVDARKPHIAYFAQKTYLNAEGTGMVWAENPVVTPQLTSSAFKYMDTTKKLSGKFARVYNANFTEVVRPGDLDLSIYTTASDPNRVYNYAEGDSRLTEAMAYFHINLVHDSWRNVGFKKLNSRAPIFVNVAREQGGEGYDNAFYTRSRRFRRTGLYVFGAGNRLNNLGLDGDVYYHEYGHGVLDRSKPGFLDALENNYAFAFHEGFSDISSSAVTGNSKLAEFALRSKTTNRFVGRNINNNNRFPRDVVLPGFGASESHYTGLIVGGAWWDLSQNIGTPEAQKILFRSLALLPRTEITFFDVRDAMLSADANINAGANQTAINNAFAGHGLGGPDPGQAGSVNVSGLRTARLNFENGNVRLKRTFDKGDVILALISYRSSSNLTPGYNLIPVETDITGPCDSCIFAFGTVDEARSGTNTRLNGAVQVFVFTDSAVSGNYTITLKTRLGGTTQISPEQRVQFRIN